MKPWQRAVVFLFAAFALAFPLLYFAAQDGREAAGFAVRAEEAQARREHWRKVAELRAEEERRRMPLVVPILNSGAGSVTGGEPDPCAGWTSAGAAPSQNAPTWNSVTGVVTVSWAGDDLTASSYYEVQSAEDNAFTISVLTNTTSTGVTSYNDDDFTAAGGPLEVFYRVRQVSPCGTSDWSNVDSVMVDTPSGP